MTGFGRGRSEPPKTARQHLKQAARLAERDPRAALAELGKAIALQPDAAEAHLQAARLLVRLGSPEAALNSYYQALASDSNLTAARLGLAELLLRLGQPGEALGHARAAGGADAQLFAAIALQQLGRVAEAEAEYRQVLARQPHCAEAWCNLGLLARERGEAAEAVRLYAEALACRPDFPEALVNQGLALEALGHYAEAATAHRRALALAPADPVATAGLASALEKQDDLPGAAQVLATAASEHPKVLLVAAALALRGGDPHSTRRRLERALAVNPYSQRDRALILFALARLADATGDPAAAFAAAREGHALRRARFDPQAFAAEIAAQKAIFATPLPPAPPVAGAERLVFIVGMPRSGTSLVEQILASHPQFAAGGERSEMPELIRALPGCYPENLAALAEGQIAALAQTYLAKLAAVAPEAKRLSDKLPGNGLHLGLICRLLPGARVIVCRRDPLDTCLSCYLHDFEGAHPYTGNLAHLGLVYRAYSELLDHWQAVLPLPIFELTYEQLVHAPEQVVRELLAFVGLDWHAGCLAFWQQRRPVLTASYAQVREPIHQRSVGRASAYRPFLDPLIAALAKK